MATTNPNKPALHGAAAASHSKTEAAKDQVKSTGAKPDETVRKTSNSGNKSSNGKKSR
jgi:hypothetical protein